MALPGSAQSTAQSTPKPSPPMAKQQQQPAKQDDAKPFCLADEGSVSVGIGSGRASLTPEEALEFARSVVASAGSALDFIDTAFQEEQKTLAARLNAHTDRKSAFRTTLSSLSAKS